MKMRRRGLIVSLIAETGKDDKRLAHFAKRYNRPLSMGFGMRQLTFELPDDIVLLRKILKGIWGETEGTIHADRLVAVITSAYKEKK